MNSPSDERVCTVSNKVFLALVKYNTVGRLSRSGFKSLVSPVQSFVKMPKLAQVLREVS